MSTEPQGQPTQFNMAIATLKRMDEVLTTMTISAMSYNYSDWLSCLTELRRLIYPFIKKEEFDEIDNYLKEANQIKWIVYDNYGKRKYVQSNMPKLYYLLDKTTLCCQKAMNDAGILMPKSDDPRLAIQG